LKNQRIIIDNPRSSRANNCDPRTCNICTKISEQTPRKAPPPPKTQISPHKRTHSRKHEKCKDNVSPGTFATVQHAMGASSRATARGVSTFRLHPTSRLHPLQPSEREIPLESRCLQMISSRHCPYSSDGAFYQVHDLAEFVRKCAWIRDKQVSILCSLSLCLGLFICHMFVTDSGTKY
jgi:hypothetical protein